MSELSPEAMAMLHQRALQDAMHYANRDMERLQASGLQPTEVLLKAMAERAYKEAWERLCEEMARGEFSLPCE